MHIFSETTPYSKIHLKRFSPLFVLGKHWLEIVTLIFLWMSVAISSKMLSFGWMQFPARTQTNLERSIHRDEIFGVSGDGEAHPAVQLC